MSEYDSPSLNVNLTLGRQKIIYLCGELITTTMGMGDILQRLITELNSDVEVGIADRDDTVNEDGDTDDTVNGEELEGEDALDW